MKDVYWFRHDVGASNDPKILRLRRKCGFEGVGVFWYIIEMLRAENERGYKLPLSAVDDIVFSGRFDAKIFDALFKSGDNSASLLAKDEDYFWSNSLLARMDAFDSVREKRVTAGKAGGDAKQRSSKALAKVKQSSSKSLAKPQQGSSKSLAKLQQSSSKSLAKPQQSSSKALAKLQQSSSKSLAKPSDEIRVDEIRVDEIRVDEIRVDEIRVDEIIKTVTGEPARVKKIAKKTTMEKTLGSEIWDSYSLAYSHRYNTEPIRNAKSNSMCKQIGERLGRDGIAVAASFLINNGQWYVNKGHSLQTLLGDCEKLCTEWKTGNSVTSTSSRESDRLQKETNDWNEIVEEFRQEELEEKLAKEHAEEDLE